MDMNIDFRALAEAYFTGNISPEDECRLFAFITENTENETQFRAYEEAWRKKSSDVSTRAAWEKLKSNMQISESVVIPFTPKRHIPWMSVAAAVAVLLVAVSGIFFWQKREEASQHRYVFEVAYGGKGQITLSDGTKVWLNAGSTLSYGSDFNKKREVELNGEGYFEVTKKNGKPFVVRSGDYELTVLGTKFDLSAYPDEKLITAALVEGSVRVECSNEVRHMTPDQTLSFDKKKEEFVELDALAKQSCAWKENNIEYDNIAMSDLFSKLNRKFNVDIRVNSEQILNEEVRVSFRNNENVDEILSALKELVPMQVERQGNTITIN